jgi:hypothetical protein
MKTLYVELGDRRYPLYIGPGLLGQTELLRPHIPGRQVLVVSNTTVAPLYLDRARAALAGLRHEAVILPDGERYKTLDTLNEVFTALLNHRLDRNCTLIALGGGVIGDMAGLLRLVISAASTSSRFRPRCWRRWIPRWWQNCGQSSTRQKHDRRLLSAALRLGRHRHSDDPAGSRVERRSGRGYQVRIDPRSPVPGMAGRSIWQRCWREILRR